jgi:hypothetical protein
VLGTSTGICVARLTSLLGGNGGGRDPTDPSMGAAEPSDKFSDGDSTPNMLDLGLPCCDNGRTDNRRIQEPFEEIESRACSAIGVTWLSPGRMKECLLLATFGGVV